MVTTHKHVHRMNNFFNKWRTKTSEISAYLEELMTVGDNSLDNDKSHAADATESDKSEDKCDQADQTPLDAVPEPSAFMNEADHAQFDKTLEVAKKEEPQQAKETPEP